MLKAHAHPAAEAAVLLSVLHLLHTWGCGSPHFPLEKLLMGLTAWRVSFTLASVTYLRPELARGFWFIWIFFGVSLLL